MVLVFFNFIGVAILAVSFGVAFGVGYLFGNTTEGFLLLIAGPIAMVCDLVYRAATRHLLHPIGGGMLMFIPIWVFGVIWTILGGVETITGEKPPDVTKGVVVGLVALFIVGMIIYNVLHKTEDSAPGSGRDWNCPHCGSRNEARLRICLECMKHP